VLFGAVLTCLLGASLAVGHERASGRPGKSAKTQEVKIAVTEAGFVPSTVTVKKGVPIVLVMTRQTDQTCATQAVFAVIKKTVDLPLNKPVRVALPAQSAGSLSYVCGMGMLHGEVVVR
jgi:plastocyanin domain-containing protein